MAAQRKEEVMRESAVTKPAGQAESRVERVMRRVDEALEQRGKQLRATQKQIAHSLKS
jgi:hypothetical protein